MPTPTPGASTRRLTDNGTPPPCPKPSAFDARRLSELSGFLLTVAGLLVSLSLLSFATLDASLNTASARNATIHNWVGPAGAYIADVLFQTLGWGAILLPLTLFIVGVRLLLARPVVAPGTRAIGVALLVVSFTGLLELFPYTPLVGGTVRGSGLIGYVTGAGLVSLLNSVGAWIVAGTVFLASLFLISRFSFFSAARLARELARLLTGSMTARFAARREAREKARLMKMAERARIDAKPTIVMQRPPATAANSPAPGTVVGPKSALPPMTAAPQRALTAGNRPAGPVAAPPSMPSRPAPMTSGRPSLGPPEAAPRPPKIVGRGAHGYKLPNPSLLRPPDDQQMIDEKELKDRAVTLTQKFMEFGVAGTVTQIHPGPVVTTYEFKPEAGIKYSRITSLVDDLCLALKAESILIDRIPGKSTVGIEVPNLHREIIYLRELVESSEFAASPSKLTLSLGKDITGKMRVADLTQMPHLLIAGSTGAGKSVAINSMIVSILYKSTPEEAKLILIDPKRLELGLYDGIPHLYTPIVTEPKVAANVLRRATMEMEQRLKTLAERGVRNIEQYNTLFETDSTMGLFDGESEREGPLSYLVIVIDELADLMMVEPQGVEESITRLAQMARAVGIHLILATQRPSVDVITGLIKANLPSRISFRVASKVDSRTILDSNGAEALLGRGDMLFMPPGSARLARLHGPLVTEKEIGRVVDWWKAQSPPHYNEEFLRPVRDKDREVDIEEDDEDPAELDAVYEEAVRLVVETGKASTSLLQRRLRLGYGRAARLIDMMQRDGIVSAPDGSKPREVLKKPDWLREIDNQLR